MCGIAGLFTPDGGCSPEQLQTTVRGMASALQHRGPDDAGVWNEEGLALGHRRLAILDLSQEGHQPMLSACGRWVVVYNGEIYNFQSLSRELCQLGHRFRSSCDTEVILTAIAAWGLEGALERFIGMFALAVYDRHERCLSLVRDRLGIKPLYYGWVGRQLVFASELKAICAVPGFARELNTQALPLFFRYGYIPAQHTVYKEVFKLAPGALVRVSADQLSRRQVNCKQYWSPAEVVTARSRARQACSLTEAGEELERTLLDAVSLRLVSDVPLGAFLSGGIDSSLVVALMQQASSTPVKTFSIGFFEQGFDEAPHAAAVARHLGTEHHELYVSNREAMEVIPDLAEMFDEPFADPSQIPTFLVARMTRREVTVALSGDGGDELFAGYTRYPFIAADWRRKSRWHRGLRTRIGSGLRAAATAPSAWPLWPLKPLLRMTGRPTVNLAERMLRRARAWEDLDLASFYHNHASFAVIPDLELLLESPEELPTSLVSGPHPALREPIEQLMYFDLLQYLPDDILTKVDRTSMAVSLETRVPLLDHRVVELAWQLPFAHKHNHGGGKLVLRHLLQRYLPSELYERPKMGFGVPFGQWLRGPLRDWAEELLRPASLASTGVLKPAQVNRRWQEHVRGSYDHQNMLWPVLMFQAWRQRWQVS